jgi:hypothetical protein
LLSDPDSRLIRAYQVLNVEAADQFRGMARPGYFFIDGQGVIRQKFFEAKYRERLSGNTLITKLFPALGAEVTRTIEAPHLQLVAEQSDRTTVPGGRITLIAEVRLPADVHVYAPGTTDYRPIKLIIDPIPDVQLPQAVYPRAKILYLPAIRERVPVFEGAFRISQDVQVASAAAFSNSLGSAGRTLTIAGKLEYQACDRTTCFLPASVPVEWNLQVLPLDRQRSPEQIRHK